VAGFALLGAGLGPAVPTAFSAAGNTPSGPGRTALAGVVTAGYLGSIIGPLAIGFTADVTGLRAALWIPAALAAVIVAAAPSLAAAAGRTARP
jgi:MFS family permease